MFSHVMVGSDDIETSKAFYDAALGTLGVRPGQQDPKGRVIYAGPGGLFLISQPIDGGRASHGNGGTIGFAADSTDAVDAWHEAGAAAGGSPIEDPPGWREGGGFRLYLAYLRDPAGNKLCAMYRPQ